MNPGVQPPLQNGNTGYIRVHHIRFEDPNNLTRWWEFFETDQGNFYATNPIHRNPTVLSKLSIDRYIQNRVAQSTLAQCSAVMWAAIDDEMKDRGYTHIQDLLQTNIAGIGSKAKFRAQNYPDITAKDLFNQWNNRIDEIENYLMQFDAGTDGVRYMNFDFYGIRIQAEITMGPNGYQMLMFGNDEALNPIGRHEVALQHGNPSVINQVSISFGQRKGLMFERGTTRSQKSALKTFFGGALQDIMTAAVHYQRAAILDDKAAPSAPSGLSQIDQWKADGKCPQCGELGAFINLQMTCSKHGPY